MLYARENPSRAHTYTRLTTFHLAFEGNNETIQVSACGSRRIYIRIIQLLHLCTVRQLLLLLTDPGWNLAFLQQWDVKRLFFFLNIQVPPSEKDGFVEKWRQVAKTTLKEEKGNRWHVCTIPSVESNRIAACNSSEFVYAIALASQGLQIVAELRVWERMLFMWAICVVCH